MTSLLTILFPTPLLPAPPPPATINRVESRGSKSQAYSGYDNVAFAVGIKGAMFRGSNSRCFNVAKDERSKAIFVV